MFLRSLPRAVRSILVLTKHHFMGDTIVAVPMLRGARQAFPQARITLVTGRQAATALEHNDFIDRLLTYNPHERGFDAPALYRALLEDGRPDLCLIADRSFRSAWIAFRSGGRVRSGFASEGRGFLLTHRVPYRADAPETECCLDIVRAVAPEGEEIPHYDPRPRLIVTAEERERGAQFLAEREAIGPVLVGIQPGASYAAKQWDPCRYAAIATALARDGACIVLMGKGRLEAEAAHAMRQAMPHEVPVVDLTDATTLRETMGVLTHLSLFIGNDTGVNHLAAAVGTATVGLFGPTLAVKWGNAGQNGIVLSAPNGDLSHLDTAPVLEAARRLLTGSAGSNRTIPLGASR